MPEENKRLNITLILDDLARQDAAGAYQSFLERFTLDSIQEAEANGITVNVRRLSSSTSPAGRVGAINRLLREIETDDIFGILKLGERWCWSAIDSAARQLLISNSCLALGKSATLTSLLSPMAGEYLDLSRATKHEMPDPRAPALLLVSPKLQLGAALFKMCRKSELSPSIASDLPFDVAARRFILNFGIEAPATFLGSVTFVEQLELHDATALAHFTQNQVADRFFYGSNSLGIGDDNLLNGTVTMQIRDLEALEKELGAREIFEPFERVLRKALGIVIRRSPKLFLQMRNSVFTMEAGLTSLAKFLRDFFLGLSGLKNSFRAGLWLIFNFLGFTNLLGIPIFINNRDRLTTLVGLLDFLEGSGFSNITIIDNASTFPPLLEFYSKTKHAVIRLNENVGPLAIWSAHFPKELPNSFYVYTDSDVVPSFPAGDGFLKEVLIGFIKYPFLRKIGLALRIDNLPDSYGQKAKVIRHEEPYWTKPVGRFYDAPVDTTFAVYAPNAKGGFWLRAFRTAPPWVAEHRPWYTDSENMSEEERYYISHAKHWASWSQASGMATLNRDEC